MEHADTAQLAALLGAAGAPLALAGHRRAIVLAGLALLATAEGAFAVALAPSNAGEQLRRPLVLAALGAAAVAGTGLAAVFARRPAWALVALAAAAPFRLPVSVGSERAFLLLPLYGVGAAAVLALAWRLARGSAAAPAHLLFALPAAAVAALSCASLLWTVDPKHGAVTLAFFYVPFTAVGAVVARTPPPPWLARALVLLAAVLASGLAAVGMWQAWTRRLFFAPDLEVANAYTTYFRVTSLFKDPSLYGRYLVIALALLLVALWLGRAPMLAVAPVTAFLCAGLLLSYSQSSFVTLAAVALAVPLVLGDRRTRTALAAAALAAALAAGAVAAVAASGDSLRSATSGRSHLVNVTLPVIEDHPLAGVGIGGQPRASAREAGTRAVKKSASHTTPLTVAAELGLLGLVAYGAFLGGAVVLLARLGRRDRPLALGLAATLLALVVHSLFYAGFFEDPLTWLVPGLAAAALAAAAAAPSGAGPPQPLAD